MSVQRDIPGSIATMNSESRTASTAQWRPIETAPKDYTVVLLYQPAGHGTAEAVGQGHRTSLNEHAHDKWMFQANGWLAEPTHWMPLPSPPVQQNGDREGDAAGSESA